MARNTPKGDKNMTNKKNKEGKRAKNDTEESSSDSAVSSVISCDLISNTSLKYDHDFDEAANYELLQKHFDQKLLLVQTKFEAQISALHDVIKEKDVTIGNLYTDIGELKASYNTEIKDLKQSCDFLTNETSVLGGRVKGNELNIASASKHNDDLVNKTADLEDRSRRNNVVFFNIPEAEVGDTENCDQIIHNLLKSKKFFEQEYTLELDRAHRLGRKKQDINARPRPIIVRFSFYKDKEHVIKNGKLLKGSEVIVREDFSRITLDIHKELRDHAIRAKNALESNTEQNKLISYFKITYRRVVLTYKSKDNPDSQTFTRSFSLQHIKSNINWFLPPLRPTYNNVHRSVGN